MAEVSVRGLRCHYQRLGDGPVRVVFVHGLVLDNLSSFYFTLATPVAQDVGVLLYDLRGHGMSERPKTGYTVDELVADLAALLDALEVREPVHLVGNSFGGLLTLAFAVAHPERVRGIVLVDSHLADEGWGERMADTLSMTGPGRDERIVELFKNWSARNSKRKRGRLAGNAEAIVHGTTLVDDMRNSAVISDDALRDLACPILALYGEGSEILDHGRRIASLAKRAELRLIAGATHLVLFEATAQLRDHVREFVRTHP